MLTILSDKTDKRWKGKTQTQEDDLSKATEQVSDSWEGILNKSQSSVLAMDQPSSPAEILPKVKISGRGLELQLGDQ